MRYSQDDDVNEFEDDEDEDELMEKIMEEQYVQNEKIEILKLAVRQQELKRKILLDSMKHLQKSFWWKFFSWETKLTMVAQTYELLSKLIFGFPEEEE